MTTANYPWRVSWGKKIRKEDRYKTKEEANKYAAKLKKKSCNGNYYNVRVGKVAK